MDVKKQVARYAGVCAAALVASGAALAQSTGIDVSAVTTGVGEAKDAIATVGGALIGLAVVVMTYRWIKGFVAGG